jgi:hypothetical protein
MIPVSPKKPGPSDQAGLRFKLANNQLFSFLLHSL